MHFPAGGRISRFAGAVVALLASCALSAQTATKPASPAAPTMTPLAGLTSPAARVIPKASPAPSPSQDFSVKLKWSDATGRLSIPFKNTSSKILTIEGVKTSGNLYLVDFPKTVPAKGTANLEVIFDVKMNTSSDSDVIHLRTDQGEQLIRVLHDRQQVAQLDKTELSWTEGEKITGKSAILQITGGVTKPVKVRAALGNVATIEPLGSGKYKITVTPKSTARLSRFPVFIDLDPALPGVTPTITATIENKS